MVTRYDIKEFPGVADLIGCNYFGRMVTMTVEAAPPHEPSEHANKIWTAYISAEPIHHRNNGECGDWWWIRFTHKPNQCRSGADDGLAARTVRVIGTVSTKTRKGRLQLLDPVSDSRVLASEVRGRLARIDRTAYGSDVRLWASERGEYLGDYLDGWCIIVPASPLYSTTPEGFWRMPVAGASTILPVFWPGSSTAMPYDQAEVTCSVVRNDGMLPVPDEGVAVALRESGSHAAGTGG
jgi:hypothetical protein